MKTLSPAELDQAKLDPGSVFHVPEDVLHTSLTDGDKKAVLLRWELDADALLQASDEGMPQADNRRRSPAELLGAIQAALRSLDDH